MGGIRQPVAAGRFYPAGADELAGLVDRLLAEAAAPPAAGRLRALLVPHAGYAYSGPVAAAAYASIPAPPGPLRAALLGPSHFAALVGAAVSGADAWRTPLGRVAVDPDLRAAALEAGAFVDERPHRDDHALEVQLPFLQRRAARGLRVLPVALGGGGTNELLATLAAGALVVVSSDLSHDHDDSTARRLDRRTARAVLDCEAGAVGDLDACGADALRALLRHARRERWACTLLALRTSADAFGDPRRVVGYGAFAFTSQP